MEVRVSGGAPSDGQGLVRVGVWVGVKGEGGGEGEGGAPGDGLVGQHVEEAVGTDHEILEVGRHLVGVRVRVRVGVRVG